MLSYTTSAKLKEGELSRIAELNTRVPSFEDDRKRFS